MAKRLFDSQNQLDIPTLILETKSGERFGSIDGVTGLTYKKTMGADSVSFVVHKYVDGILHPLWEDITDLKTLFIPEYGEKFEIKITYEDEEYETKSVSAVSLCEAELSQILLRNFEVNTETDIARDDYRLTVFYDPDHPDASLLHRVLSAKASFYQIGEVDETLRSLSFEFSADNTDVYQFLTDEVAKEMQCIFLFDSMTRTIHVYDLNSTCNECFQTTPSGLSERHYRGDFHDICPNCGSTNIRNGFGEDTTILIDRESIASSIVVESDADALKNCFYVEGGDDVMTAAFCLINPNGTPCLYYFPPRELDKKASDRIYKFPDELIDALNAYDTDYRYYLTQHTFDPSRLSHIYHPGTNDFTPTTYDPQSTDLNYITAYNAVVEKISGLSDQSPYHDCIHYKSTLTFKGQSALVAAYFNSVDFEAFVQTKMMPDCEMEVCTKEEAIRKLTSASLGTIAIAGFGSATTRTVVDNAVLMTAKTIVNTALFDVGIESSVYTAGNSSWTGRFVITDRQDDNVGTRTIVSPQNVTLSVNGDIPAYCRARIKSLLSKNDLPATEPLYDLTITDADFKSRIALYGADQLKILYNVMLSCLDVLQEQLDKSGIRKENSVTEELKRYYSVYHRRMGEISAKISEREADLNSIWRYKALLCSYLETVRSILSFPSYLAQYAKTHALSVDLWELFNLHRREETYRNSHIISDSLKNNSDIIRHAGSLMELAKRELITAGTLQYSISASLSSLLALTEFAPLTEHFEIGNWIRVRTDIREDTPEDSIYHLRLLSYQITFDDVQEIDVEFSTVTKTWSGMQDSGSVLESIQGIASSYDGVKRQTDKNSAAADIVDDWVAKGLDMTNQKIVNSTDSQAFVIDEHGLLARSYDDLTDVYGPCQLKILHNGLYTTHNSWETVDAGIGSFIYYDPLNQFRETVGYGLIAKTVVGSLILGENLGIYNKTGSMRFDEEGLVISNGKNTIFIRPDKTAFEICRGTTKQFYLDMDGNATFRGTIYADAGEFTGTINAGSTITGSHISGSTIRTKNNLFHVAEDGKTTVKDLIVTDSIYGQYSHSSQPAGIAEILRFVSTPAYSYDKIFYSESLDEFVSVTENYKGPAKESSSLQVCPDVCSFDSVALFKNVADFRQNVFFRSTAAFSDGASVGKALHVSGNIHTDGSSYTGSDLHVDGSLITQGEARLHGDVYFHSLIRLQRKGERHISAQWADGRYHTLLSLYDDGLKLAVGWTGLSEDGETYPTDLVLRGQTVHAPYASGMTVTSDERLKRSFESLDAFDDVYMDLRPVSFEYVNGSSGRRHFGFGAGAVRENLEMHGFTTQDFAGFVQISEKPESQDYCGIEDPMGLIYTEFIAWNTHMIQQTRRELDELRLQVKELSEKYNRLLPEKTQEVKP